MLGLDMWNLATLKSASAGQVHIKLTSLCMCVSLCICACCVVFCFVLFCFVSSYILNVPWLVQYVDIIEKKIYLICCRDAKCWSREEAGGHSRGLRQRKTDWSLRGREAGGENWCDLICFLQLLLSLMIGHKNGRYLKQQMWDS